MFVSSTVIGSNSTMLGGKSVVAHKTVSAQKDPPTKGVFWVVSHVRAADIFCRNHFVSRKRNYIREFLNEEYVSIT